MPLRIQNKLLVSLASVSSTTLLEQSIKLTFDPPIFTEGDVSGVRLVSAHKAASFWEGSMWHSETTGSAGAENIPSLVMSAA